LVDCESEAETETTEKGTNSICMVKTKRGNYKHYNIMIQENTVVLTRSNSSKVQNLSYPID